MTDGIKTISAFFVLCIGYTSAAASDGFDTLLPPDAVVQTGATASATGTGTVSALTVMELKERLHKAENNQEFAQAAGELLPPRAAFPADLMLSCLRHEVAKDVRPLWEIFVSVLQLRYKGQPDVLESLFSGFNDAVVLLKAEACGGTRKTLKSTTISAFLGFDPMNLAGNIFPKSFLDYYRAISIITQRIEGNPELNSFVSHADFFEALHEKARGGNLFEPVIQAYQNLTPSFIREMAGVTYGGHFGLYFDPDQQQKIASIAESQAFLSILGQLPPDKYDVSHAYNPLSHLHMTMEAFGNMQIISGIIAETLSIHRQKAVFARRSGGDVWNPTLAQVSKAQNKSVETKTKLSSLMEQMYSTWRSHALPKKVQGGISDIIIFEPNPTTRWLVLLIKTNVNNENNVIAQIPHVSLIKILKQTSFKDGELECLRPYIEALKKEYKGMKFPFSSFALTTEYAGGHYPCFEARL